MKNAGGLATWGWAWLLVWSHSCPAKALKETEKELTAYDCSVPLGVERVFATAKDECGDLQPETSGIANKTFVLLQRAVRERLVVRSCHLHASSVAAYCGMHSHSVLIPSLFYAHKRMTVPIAQCRKYWAGRAWVNKEPQTGQEISRRPIKNGVVDMNWMEAGTSEASGTGRSANCEGATYDSEAGRRTDMIAGRSDQLELKEEQATISGGRVVLSSMGKVLPCAASLGHCSTNEGTYTWDPPQVGCKLYRARKDPVQGQEATTELGTTFLSTDGAMLRLIKKAAVSECGAVVYATDYERLFLVEAEEAEKSSDFARMIHPSEVSIVTYANQQDAFLFDRATDYFKEELTSVLRKDCESGSRKRNRAYARLAAEHRSTVDGETVALGEGFFATAGGEAWYRYRCRALTVRALSEDRCFSAMPVRLAEADARAWQRTRGQGPPLSASDEGQKDKMNETVQDMPPLFIEPKSHRLTEIGLVRPCAPTFAGVYKTAAGLWLAATPELQLVRAPKDLEEVERVEISDAPSYDMEGGGIYDIQTIFRQEELLNSPRHMKNMVGFITRAATTNKYDPNDSYLRQNVLFAGMPDLGMGWIAKVFLYLDKWSRATSLVLGIFVLVKLVIWAAELFLRCVSIQRVHGIGMSLLSAMVPRCAKRETKTRGWARRQRDYARPKPGGGDAFSDDDGPIIKGPATKRQLKEWKTVVRRERATRAARKAANTAPLPPTVAEAVPWSDTEMLKVDADVRTIQDSGHGSDKTVVAAGQLYPQAPIDLSLPASPAEGRRPFVPFAPELPTNFPAHHRGWVTDAINRAAPKLHEAAENARLRTESRELARLTGTSAATLPPAPPPIRLAEMYPIRCGAGGPATVAGALAMPVAEEQLQRLHSFAAQGDEQAVRNIVSPPGRGPADVAPQEGRAAAAGAPPSPRP